jgi:hypothetical protein
MDYDLPLPFNLSQAAGWAGEGLLDSDRKVSRLERQVARLKEQNARLSAKIASSGGSKRKEARTSDLTNSEKNSSKIIVALTAAYLGNASKGQFVKIKNGSRTDVVTNVVNAVHSMGWKIDEGSVLNRFREALEHWDPSETS